MFKILIILVLTGVSAAAQSIDSTLHMAYKQNSQILLEEFFLNWKTSNKLSYADKLIIEEKLRSDDTLKEIYDIANTFYKHERPEAKYRIIEDTIKYTVCSNDSVELCLWKYDNLSRITNYRLNEDDVDWEILYLGYAQNVILTDFFWPRYENTYENYEKASNDYKSKADFLKNYIKFDRARLLKSVQFGKNDILDGIPLVLINKSLTKAIVYISGGSSVITTLWERSDIWKYVRTLTEAGE